MNMPRSIFNSIFGGRKKQKQDDEDEDIQPPERRLSISKSGRMRANKQRQTVTDGLFSTDQKENKQVKTSDTKRQPVDSHKIKNDTRKSSLSDEDLDIEEVIREIQQTAL